MSLLESIRKDEVKTLTLVETNEVLTDGTRKFISDEFSGKKLIVEAEERGIITLIPSKLNESFDRAEIDLNGKNTVITGRKVVLTDGTIEKTYIMNALF